MSEQALMPLAERPRTVFPEIVRPVSAEDEQRALCRRLVAEQIAEDERAALAEAFTQYRVEAHLRRKFAEKPSATSTRQPLSVEQLNRMAEVAFYLDHGLFEGPEVGAGMSAEDRRFAYSADGRFLALCREKTGETAEPKQLEKWRREAAELLRQSHAIAEKMASAGFDAYRNTPYSVFRYYVHSGHVERLPGFRRCTFIPYVAQQIRAPIVAALESFLERHPFARMWVFTTGPRTPLCDVRERAKWLHGRISDLNAEPFMREAGVEIVFRSTELGTPEFNADGTAKDGGEVERDENGQLYFHVHAHTVVHLKKGFIPPKEWSALLSRVGAFWGHWWKDGAEDASGLIVKPREVCKYVTKPGEMLKLSGEELVALQAQLHRLKLVQPMGELAKEIKRRENPENPMRLVRVRTDDGSVLREVQNWNRRMRKTRAEQLAEAAAKLEKSVDRDTVQVVSRGLPRIGPSGVSEPVVTVMATRWQEDAVRRVPVVETLIRATWEEYRAGRIMVHTCTSTVGETRPLSFVESLPPPKIPLSGAEMAGFSR